MGKETATEIKQKGCWPLRPGNITSNQQASHCQWGYSQEALPVLRQQCLTLMVLVQPVFLKVVAQGSWMDESHQVEISRRHLHPSSHDLDHLHNRYRLLPRGCLHGLPLPRQVMEDPRVSCLQDSTHHNRKHFLHQERDLPRALGLLQALVHLQVKVLRLECHQVFNSQATGEPGSDQGNTREKTRSWPCTIGLPHFIYAPMNRIVSEAEVSKLGSRSQTCSDWYCSNYVVMYLHGYKLWPKCTGILLRISAAPAL